MRPWGGAGRVRLAFWCTGSLLAAAQAWAVAPVADANTARGVLRAENEAVLASPVSERIVQMPFREGDTLTYALGTGPTNGTVTVDPVTGGYVYTPNGDFNGTDSFVITISDGTTTVQATVNMTVTPVVDIADDTATTPEDTAVVINVNGNDTFENPGHVVSAINGGAITAGTPVAVATFTYTVSSGGVTETATVTVSVVPFNIPPTPAEPPGGNPPGQTFDQPRAPTPPSPRRMLPSPARSAPQMQTAIR